MAGTGEHEHGVRKIVHNDQSHSMVIPGGFGERLGIYMNTLKRLGGSGLYIRADAIGTVTLAEKATGTIKLEIELIN